MAAAHTPRTILASTSNAAGGTSSGAEVDNSAGYGLVISGKVVNTTAPTTGVDLVIYVGDATGKKYEYSRQTFPVTASSTFPFSVQLPPQVMFVNVDFTGNTGQAVTVEAYGQHLTGI